MDALPRTVRDCKEYVICGPHLNLQTTSSYSTSTFNALGYDHDWNFQDFVDQFEIIVRRVSDEDMEFDLIGIHASIANALRRIMISELPTMAIEHVFIKDNTGVVQDELLAHRLGLIPIKADPRLFEWKTGEEPANERNCIVFKLEVECGKTMGHSKDQPAVKSSDLQWLPNGSEMPIETNCRFLNNQRQALKVPELHPVNGEILLTKLRSGQVIELEAHCVKGIGKTHAKWSPVATTWYRLLPEVVLLREVHGEKAQYLINQFPGLFTLERKSNSGKEVARVTNTRDHEVYLEQIRTLSGDPNWSNKIQLRKRKDYFIYTVESVGQYRASEVFSEALKVLIEKCTKLMEAL